MEEEFYVIEKNFKELKGELDKLREVIERKSHEERGRKKNRNPRPPKKYWGNEDSGKSSGYDIDLLS